MNQQDKESLIERWLDSKITDEELLHSIPREELYQYKAILQTVDNWIPEGGEASNQLDMILSVPKEAKVVRFNRIPWIAGIAASLLLVATISYFFLWNTNTVYYAESGNLEILLPDGSTTVVLSQGASLSYDDFDNDNREVEVTGRAYFDVTEKGPFKVRYQEGAIAVLGTQFEIFQVADFFEATCFEGKVQVRYKEAIEELAVGERVNFVQGDLPKIQINQKKPGWVDGEEVFDNDHLAKVIKVIELRYDVRVNVNQISLARRFTGTIPEKDMDGACRRVFSALGINYKIQNKVIILSE